MTAVHTMMTLGLAVVLLGVGAGNAGAEQVEYGVEMWDIDGRGSHRAVVHVSEPAEAVRVRIPWRRRDREPAAKDIRVFDATTGERIMNVVRVEVNPEYGDLVFEPVTAPGNYYVYYLPHRALRGNFDIPDYFSPEDTADAGWVNRNGLTAERLALGQWQSLPQAEVVQIQARSEFDSFYPMEVVATQQETAELLARYPERDYLLFPEGRRYPIRMFARLPLRWINRGPSEQFIGHAQPGEYYVFQLGVWAARATIEDVELEFSDLIGEEGKVIGAEEMTCFNLEGTDWLGRPMEKVFRVGQGQVRALWIGVPIPPEASGTYQGSVKVQPRPGEETTVQIRLEVGGEVLTDHGDSELWRHSRLRWLNSTLGLDEEVIPPYTPLEVEGNTIKCLGREVEFGETGLPTSIRSYFHHSELASGNQGREILAGPVQMVVETAKGPVNWQPESTEVPKANEGIVLRKSIADSEQFRRVTWARMEFDGCLVFRVILKAKQPVDISDIRLEVPLRSQVAEYMMGFGKLGGYRPPEWEWKWKIERSDNMVWLGDADAGLQCKLMPIQDVWQWGNLRDTGLPESWDNEGQGGASISEVGDQVLLRAFSGQRHLQAGEQLVFRFRFLLTPFKPIDKNHWNWRVGDVKRGGNIIHYHHSSTPNPYINYPFLEADKLASAVYADKVRGYEKVMIYYTVRELSNHVVEMWALRSLGDEIFLTGDPRGTAPIYEVMGTYEEGSQAGGYPWLREHLVAGYSWRWLQPLGKGEVDAAIATTPLSRWHNYYIEGLRWLIENTTWYYFTPIYPWMLEMLEAPSSGLTGEERVYLDIDGLYLDGIGYDREIMKRVAKVLYRLKPDNHYIQFHSGNTGHKYQISPMNGYMEHLPYISELWFGELYDYDSPPDYWLVEITGIPFGLTGEMLDYTPQYPGNQWRAMLYGMDGRNAPSKYAIWRFWDEFGIQEAEMIGYWERDCPVQTGREDILATVYRKQDKALIALASWSEAAVEVNLDINWQALGLDPATATLTAPPIANFQEAAKFAPDQPIPVESAKGWLLVVED